MNYRVIDARILLFTTIVRRCTILAGISKLYEKSLVGII